jgi:tRNA A37 N6-isopentenylltransferase MiaA
MKYIFPVITLLIGFGIGWHFSGKRIQENVKAVMPEELHPSVEAVAEYFAPMTKEEVKKSMDSMKAFTEQVVNEMDYETFWNALNAEIYRGLLNKEGKEEAIRYADDQTLYFIEQYEEGMELGVSQKVADALYKRNLKKENNNRSCRAEARSSD